MSSRTNNAARQHGAMEHTDAPCDLDAVRHYRLARVRQALASHDLAGIVLYDQVNTRYVSTPVEDSAKGRRKRLPPGLVG